MYPRPTASASSSSEAENVVEVPLDEALRGEVSLPANGPGVVVLVAPTAPVTGVPAAYRVAVEYVE